EANGGINSSYQAGLQVAAYEVDLFGRLRSLDAAAQAALLGAEANQQAVRIALVAGVATAEIALQADEALLRITRDTLASREQSLQLIRQRFEGGITSEIDLRAAESALQAARVALAQTQRQRALDENALVLLLGSALPADLPAPSGALADFEPLAELPAGLPSEVLTRRPDVRQAEQQLAVADANIDAARAAFFPRITLTGSLGTASNQLSGLFKNSAWSFAPSLVQPLFDAGRNRANLAQARAQRDIATAQYEKAIQSAFRDVADALAGRATLAEQRSAQAAQVDAESRRLALAEERYRAGIASSLDVLDAQRSLFAAQQALVQVQSQRAQNLVAVYRTLGGGA
ncbi:efflux transporter outer membrane subunit, partial [Roseateles sp.]|uniref:efflux transporter outer membrane subunit n=1 Tax=Roseateles sp. TaxID=1971397 RepID=UPI002E06B0BE